MQPAGAYCNRNGDGVGVCNGDGDGNGLSDGDGGDGMGLCWDGTGMGWDGDGMDMDMAAMVLPLRRRCQRGIVDRRWSGSAKRKPPISA